MILRAEVRVQGRVVNENGAPVSGAQVMVRPQSDSAPKTQVVSDTAGDFQLSLSGPGDYRVEAEKEGFFRFEGKSVRFEDGENEISLILNQRREVFASVDVTASPPQVDMDKTVAEQRMTGSDILSVPYPTTNNLKNALRIVPGIVQDSRGGVHQSGGSEEQTRYTLNGFALNDPLTGRFESRISVEAVQELEVMSGRLPAEFGKGSAGTLAIRTTTGDDKLRYTATNFFPSLERRKKGMFLSSLSPRVNVSGPIRRGRAWFSNSFDTQYIRHIVEELPKGEDRSWSWRWSDLLQTQVNLTPSNILYSGLLINYWTSPRSGLTALDPRETTIDRRTRQWLFFVKDQIYMQGGAILELGYSMNRTFGREIPQGEEFFRFLPEGKRGNYYTDAVRRGGRDQGIANLFLPRVQAAGSHQLKTGADVERTTYWQDVRRTGFENYRMADEPPVRRVVFGGSGRLKASDTEAAVYLQDSWRVRPRLLVEAGARADWNGLLGAWTWSPRLGFAWAPPGMADTKISGGYAVTRDSNLLRLFTRPQDQYSLATYFNTDGAIDRGPAVSVFTIGRRQYSTPFYRNWSLGVERQLPGGLYAKANYMRRRGQKGLTYYNSLAETPPPADQVARFRTTDFDAIYDLCNRRNDTYDSIEVTLRQTFRRQYDWLASYTRSRALSNAVVDVNVDEPVMITQNAGRMPWDSPNRLVSWGYLPTPRKNWAIAYLLEVRDGFPFSVTSERGDVLGRVNAMRFPMFFELNLHAERRLVLRRQRIAFRFGFNNITNHRNYNVVNSNADSPNFLQFYGGQSRSLNFRVRWLGKESPGP